MKKPILFAIAAILFSLSAFAQEETETISKVDVLYDVHLPLMAARCTDVSGVLPDNPHYDYIPKYARFYVLEYPADGGAIVQFWYNGKEYDDNRIVWLNATNKAQGIRNTYFIRQQDLARRTRRRYSTSFFSKSRNIPFSGTSITGGVTILPFKFRPRVEMNGKKDGFEFSKDLQLGLSGGLRQRISHYNKFFVNAVINIGISSVTMDQYNTLETVTKPVDIAALTFAYGLVLDFDKIQFGVFAGRDKVSDRNHNNWIYQGKTWWSVGFGYSIFSVSTKSIAGN